MQGGVTPDRTRHASGSPPVCKCTTVCMRFLSCMICCIPFLNQPFDLPYPAFGRPQYTWLSQQFFQFVVYVAAVVGQTLARSIYRLAMCTYGDVYVLDRMPPHSTSTTHSDVPVILARTCCSGSVCARIELFLNLRLCSNTCRVR